MRAKRPEPANKALYNKRGWMIEGVFGEAKEGRNCRRFMRRGMAACDAEWKLIHTAGNIRKAWRKQKASGRPDSPSSPEGPGGGLNATRWSLRGRFCRQPPPAHHALPTFGA